ncbi:MAG: hypothetical protein GWO02_20530, partial [Gammaproteobacteria bacterium]|nr:hypothetical protein [Gammaproteobacteria bacterium]
SVDFYTAAFYSSANPPPGWGATGIPAAALDFPPLNMIPALFSYRNIGEIVDQGIELGV